MPVLTNDTVGTVIATIRLLIKVPRDDIYAAGVCTLVVK